MRVASVMRLGGEHAAVRPAQRDRPQQERRRASGSALGHEDVQRNQMGNTRCSGVSIERGAPRVGDVTQEENNTAPSRSDHEEAGVAEGEFEKQI